MHHDESHPLIGHNSCDHIGFGYWLSHDATVPAWIMVCHDSRGRPDGQRRPKAVGRQFAATLAGGRQPAGDRRPVPGGWRPASGRRPAAGSWQLDGHGPGDRNLLWLWLSQSTITHLTSPIRGSDHSTQRARKASNHRPRANRRRLEQISLEISVMFSVTLWRHVGGGRLGGT